MSNPWQRDFLLLALIFLFPFCTHADVMFTEVMYDLPGADESHEWVEIQNTGIAPLNTAGFTFFEADTNHKIKPIQGGAAIPPQGYAVIVANAPKFIADWPGFQGVILDSSFSLSNSGETLVLKDASSTPLATLIYDARAAAGDGNSLNLVDGAWVVRRPSPGAPASAGAVAPQPAATPSAKGGSASGGKATVVPKKPTVPSKHEGNVVTPEAVHTSVAPSAGVLAASGAFPDLGILPWIGGVMAVVALGIGAAFLARPKGEADRYTIIEDQS